MRRVGLAVAAVLIGSLGDGRDARRRAIAWSRSTSTRTRRKLAFTGRLIAKEAAGRGERYTYRVKRVFKVAESLELSPGEEVILPVSLIEAVRVPPGGQASDTA